MKLVLVADDEAKIVKLVCAYLEAAGFETSPASDGRAALEAARSRPPDCAILDIGMPGMDGLDLARELRGLYPELPVIFLTARSEETDRVVGLELGADDYVVKPFSPRELAARVKAVLRRSRRGGEARPGGRVLSQGGLRLDLEKRAVAVDGAPKELTAVQFSILSVLMAEPGRVFDRASLLEAAIGSRFEGYERTIDAHIKNIRRALGDSGEEPRFIGTVRGVGYKLIERGDEA
ncbi:MAG TPA: response regulator transcription factor [Spirochaetales bacterium]|nr:response regulator transcription factor [Spirochaetales bacterium]